MLFLQVVFANNPISGVLIFISLTVADPLVSAAGLLTASVGLLGSIVVSANAIVLVSCGREIFYSLLNFISKCEVRHEVRQFLLSRLIPYIDEITGDHQCEFRRNR
jgi:hypothetical protein